VCGVTAERPRGDPHRRRCSTPIDWKMARPRRGLRRARRARRCARRRGDARAARAARLRGRGTRRPARGGDEGPLRARPRSGARRDADDVRRRVRLLGYRVSNTFHRDGHISVALMPRDAQENTILSSSLYLKLVVDCNIPFPMTAAVAMGAVREPAPNRPFRFGVTLDSSGSMGSSAPDNLRVPAAGRFVDAVHHHQARDARWRSGEERELRFHRPSRVALPNTVSAALEGALTVVRGREMRRTSSSWSRRTLRCTCLRNRTRRAVRPRSTLRR
jgi:hypothetical protein